VPGTEILISPDGMIEVKGDLRRTLFDESKSCSLWLGEEALTRLHIVSVHVQTAA
jgi:hypothetical protein